jgi:hypothetical protein
MSYSFEDINKRSMIVRTSIFFPFMARAVSSAPLPQQFTYRVLEKIRGRKERRGREVGEKGREVRRGQERRGIEMGREERRREERRRRFE